MNSLEPSAGQQPAGTNPAVETLLCLLASYETYGAGQAWPHCLQRLPETGEWP